MAAAPARWTAAQVRELPEDGRRYEVIDGELFVTPAPPWKHQDAALHLVTLIRAYVRSTNIGHAIIAPTDVDATHVAA